MEKESICHALKTRDVKVKQESLTVFWALLHLCFSLELFSVSFCSTPMCLTTQRVQIYDNAHAT